MHKSTKRQFTKENVFKLHFQRVYVCVKTFRRITRVPNSGQEMFTILHDLHIRLRGDFVIRKLDRKKGINIHAALRRFRKI